MDKALQTMIDNMPEKTGKSLQEWKTILKEKSFSKHSEGVKFLKSEHGVTHGFANTIVSLSKEESLLCQSTAWGRHRDQRRHGTKFARSFL